MKYLILSFIIHLVFGTLNGQGENHCEGANDATRAVIAGGSITEIFYFLGVPRAT